MALKIQGISRWLLPVYSLYLLLADGVFLLKHTKGEN